MGYRRKPNAIVDVPRLLERLGIKTVRVAPTKLEGACPHPDHDSNPHAWFIRDDPKSEYHGTHKCQSCGFSGGAVLLVRTVLDVEEEQAREWMKDLSAPRPLPLRLEVEELEKRPPFMQFPQGVVWSAAEPWPDEALAYLEKRGVPLEQAFRWRVGYVPADAEDEAGEPHRLRRRIVFPCLDREGRLLGYTARAWNKTTVRYLEPRKEEYPSAAAVYGEHLWAAQKAAVAVEGVFDAMAVERSFPELAVAALAGSSGHPSQMLKLARFGAIVVATDGDQAGRKAWERAREQLGGMCRLVRACPPEGRDLADMREDERRAFLEPAVRGIIGW